MPLPFAAALFTLKMGELGSALAILVLAFVSTRHIFIAVNLFGAFVALRAAMIVIDALVHGRMFSRNGLIERDARSRKFWSMIGLNTLAIAFGVFLIWVPIK